MITQTQKRVIGDWGRRLVPVMGYLTALAMTGGAIEIVAGSIFFGLMFDELAVAALGFIGAMALAGHGVLLFFRLLDTRFCQRGDLPAGC